MTFVKKSLFDGKGYEKDIYRPLTPSVYPPKYQRYIKEETALLKQKLKGSESVLEAGVGIGRVMKDIAPLVKKFVGVDKSEFMIRTSKNVAKKYPNVTILKLDLENLSKKFRPHYFSYSLCLWNTIGNTTNEVKVLQELSIVTKNSVFITVHKKGKIEDRKKWYKTVGIPIVKADDKKEIFYFEGDVQSRAYSLEDLTHVASKAGLSVKNAQTLGGVVLWVELEKKNHAERLA